MASTSESIYTFGTQYLRGYSPDRSQWSHDLALIKELGFNTIRVWLVWGVLEPAEGSIDFDYIDEILRLAETNGLRVIFLFHMHGAPEWAISKHRDCWYVNQEGQPFEPSARANTPSGGWPGLCPDHAVTQELEEAFISAVCRHVGDRAFAYEPINEPHEWVDFVNNPNGYFCFCEATRRRFRTWLQARYGTLEALGVAWGHRYSNWDDVRPPTWNFGYPDIVDWRMFTTENIAALVQRRTAIIRKNCNVQVIAHAWGGGTLTCPNLGGMAFDDWKNSQGLDKWGCSAFPGRLNQTCHVGLSMDGTRSAAQGKEFWQSELGTGDFAGGFNRALPADAAVFAIWCWEAIGHGSRGLLFWQFRKELYGNESGAYGLLDVRGNLSPRALTASNICKLLNAHADLFNHAVMPQSRVAIVFSYRSFMLNWAEQRQNRISSDAVSGYYRMFWEHNIPVDIVHEEFTTAEQLKAYNLVIVPTGFTLSKVFTELLEAYVKQGGTLLSDPMLSMWDEHQRLSDDIPGNGLAAMFGAHEDTCRSQGNGSIKLTRADGRVLELANSPFKATWLTDDGTSVWASDEAGKPVIVMRPYGKGRACLTGVNLGNMYSQQTSISDDFRREGVSATNQAACDVVLELATETCVKSSFETAENLRIRHLKSGDKDILIVFEYARQATETSFAFADGSERRWCNLQDGTEGVFCAGATTLSFQPNEVKVLVVEA